MADTIGPISCTPFSLDQSMNPIKPTLVIHAGAIFGDEDYDPSKKSLYESTLREALSTGYEILKNGRSSLDAVEKSIQILETSGLFDAGRGAVFTSDGSNELDASIMDGSNLRAGSVAAINRVRYPISAARAVMEKSQHVLLMGKGAEEFARDIAKLEMVEPSYFFNKDRYEIFKKISDGSFKIRSHETVGAVALDTKGNIAAGTSTGGLENKHFGRVGDSPIIGAGTYADNATCAISCTGEGEYFIRKSAAFHVHALIKYAHKNLQEACDIVLKDEILPMDAWGGMIGVNTSGDIAMPYTSKGMYRGYMQEDKMVIPDFHSWAD